MAESFSPSVAGGLAINIRANAESRKMGRRARGSKSFFPSQPRKRLGLECLRLSQYPVSLCARADDVLDFSVSCVHRGLKRNDVFDGLSRIPVLSLAKAIDAASQIEQRFGIKRADFAVK